MSKKNTLINYFVFIVSFLILAITLILIGIHLSNTSAILSYNNSITNEDPLPTIILDAGHGGEDGGTIGTNGNLEKDLNLKIVLDLYEILKCSNFPVILTRSEDILLYDTNIDYHGRKKALDLAKRLEIAQEHENSIFISIHQNSFSDSKYSGLQVYYSINDPSSSDLAERIQLFNKQALQPKNERKTKAAGKNIFLLDRINTTAVLVECGFLSNQKECEMLSNEDYQKKLATVMYAAILDYLENYKDGY
jgi:N-acetylmuramoyl-L-alanine amidase